MRSTHEELMRIYDIPRGPDELDILMDRINPPECDNCEFRDDGCKDCPYI